MDDHPECCIIDPFDNVSSVLDRMEIQQILSGLQELNTGYHCKIRGPSFLKVLWVNDIYPLIIYMDK